MRAPPPPLPLVFSSDFRPGYHYWILVQMLRKFCEVAVALMFSSTPLFQAWCVLAARSSSSLALADSGLSFAAAACSVDLE
jgi:hypothetical protein